MNETEKIAIDRRSKGNFSLSEGYSFKIVAASESHEDRVSIKPEGKLPSGEMMYSVKNPNDSPISIHIYKQ